MIQASVVDGLKKEASVVDCLKKELNKMCASRDQLVGELDKMKMLMMDTCLLYTSPSPRDLSTSRMPSSA